MTFACLRHPSERMERQSGTVRPTCHRCFEPMRRITLAGMAKRGYSREFTPKTDRRVRLEIDRIPPTLFDAVKAKAKREGVSLRALTLRLWTDWLQA